MRILGLLLVLIFTAQVAMAQSSYKTWNNPDTVGQNTDSDKKLRRMVRKLNRMLDKAEQARAADPSFLRDLRDLARRYDQPRHTVILSDQFLDGNFEVNPTWHVTSGEYWVEKGWGLRSAINRQANAQQPAQNNNKDAAAQIFGQILNQALGGKQTSTNQQPTQQTRAVIYTAANIPNAFALTANIRSGATESGRFIIAMYQGNFSAISRAIGYRLAYKPGGSLDLIKRTSRGSTILDTTTLRRPLEDNKYHTIGWQRSSNGRMAISVDGHEVLSTNDRGFSDPFNGLALINRGGDYIVKKIEVSSRR